MKLPPFSLLRDFSFQNTSEHFAIRFRQSYLIWEVCDITAIELSKGIRMAPNYRVNLRWRVIYWLVRGFKVVDVARILHVWQIFVKKFRHFFRIKYPLGGLSYVADGKRAFNLVNKLNRSVKFPDLKIANGNVILHEYKSGSIPKCTRTKFRSG